MTSLLQRQTSGHQRSDAAPRRRRILGTALPTATSVLLVLLIAHVLVKLVLFQQLAHAPLMGDETAYANSARALSNLVRDLAGFGPIDVPELRHNVVGSGWFMPGISMLLTPVFVVDPDASVTVIRAYTGVVTTLLLLATVLSVRRVFGDLYAAVLLVFPGLVPMWLLFSYAAWGDLCAGLMIVILVTQLVTAFRGFQVGVAPTPGQGLRLGLIAVAVLFLRSSASLLVLAMGTATVVAAVAMLRGRVRARALIASAVAGAAFLAILLPWSLFASDSLGGRVVTTTSVPTVTANTFGDREEICFGPCDPGSTIWFNPLRYSREVGRATGLSEIEVAQQMSAYARRDVTPGTYAADVLHNFTSYVGEPARFARFLRAPGEQGGLIHGYVGTVTNLMFFSAVLATLVVLLIVVRASFDTQVTGLLVKLGIVTLLTQPFVHIAGARYWTSAAPLAAVGIALLLHLVWLRRSPDSLATTTTWVRHPTADRTPRSARVADPARVWTVLVVVQAAIAAFVVLVATGLLLVGR